MNRTQAAAIGARGAVLAACRRRDELYARWLRGRGWTLTGPDAFGHDDCEHDPVSVNGTPICTVNGTEEP